RQLVNKELIKGSKEIQQAQVCKSLIKMKMKNRIKSQNRMKMKIKKSKMMSKNPKKIKVMESKKKNQMNRKNRRTMLKTKAKKTIPIKKMRIKRIERHTIYKYASLFFSWSNFSFSFACASSLLYINVIRDIHHIVDFLLYSDNGQKR